MLNTTEIWCHDRPASYGTSQNTAYPAEREGHSAGVNSTTIWGRPGQTLLELMVSMTISSVLLSGMATSIYLAGRSASSSGATSDTMTATRLAVQLKDELRFATYIIEWSDQRIDFVVADRTNDGVPDRIYYEWDGHPGSPLLRSINGTTPQVLTNDVMEFDVNYVLQRQNEDLSPDLSPVESGETLVMEQAVPAESNVTPISVRSNRWLAQYIHPDSFNPPLPADAISWTMTKAELRLAKAGNRDGRTLIQVRPATGDNEPSSVVLEQFEINETNLSKDFEWKDFHFKSLAGLSPRQGHCLVLQWDGGIKSARVESGNQANLSGELHSTDQGSTWTDQTSKSIFYRVFGTYTVPDPSPVTVSRVYLNGVQFSLRLGNNPLTRVQTGLQVFNRPELLSACFRADFDQDPGGEDANLDSVADWIWNNGSTNPAKLVSGIWIASSSENLELRTHPANDFTQLTTVEIQCRATSTGGWGPTFRMPVDRNTFGYGEIFATLELELDGTQTFCLFDGNAVTNTLLVEVKDLEDGFLNIRLVIDPATDRVAVWLEDVFQGSFSFARYANHHHRYFAAKAHSVDAEFKSINVRVSQTAP